MKLVIFIFTFMAIMERGDACDCIGCVTTQCTQCIGPCVPNPLNPQCAACVVANCLFSCFPCCVGGRKIKSAPCRECQSNNCAPCVKQCKSSKKGLQCFGCMTATRCMHPCGDDCLEGGMNALGLAPSDEYDQITIKNNFNQTVTTSVGYSDIYRNIDQDTTLTVRHEVKHIIGYFNDQGTDIGCIPFIHTGDAMNTDTEYLIDSDKDGCIIFAKP